MLASKPRNGGVLFVDMDPQRNASRRLLQGTDEDFAGPGLAEVLRGQEELGDVILESRSGHDLDVLPAGIALDDTREWMVTQKVSETLLDRAVIQPAREVWKWIVLDLPPSLDQLCLSGLVAADYVVSPVVFDGDSYQGVLTTREALIDLRDAGLPAGKHIGAVAMKAKGGRGAVPLGQRVTFDQLKAAGIPLLGEVADRMAWPNSQAAGELAWEYEPKGPTKTQISAIVDAIRKRAK